MSELSEEHILIDLIQHYPFIYDKTAKEYKDNNIKNNAWEAIAAAMATTVEDVPRMWKLLRERYGRERKVEKHIPSGSAPHDSSWPLFRAMNFLDKHITSRRRISNISRPASCPSSRVTTPLTSPTESLGESIAWNTMKSIVIEEHTEEEVPEQDVFEEAGPPPPKRFREEKDAGQAGTSTPKLRKKVAGSGRAIEETLVSLNRFISERAKPDKNMAFGQYVGMTLNEMGILEQNHKKLRLVEILNEKFE